MTNPVPFRLNDTNALRLLREIAADSARVVLLTHAKQRMRQRQITLAQVLDVMRKGWMAEPATVDNPILADQPWQAGTALLNLDPDEAVGDGWGVSYTLPIHMEKPQPHKE